MDTLVLNSHRLPLRVTTWQDAFVMICSGRAEVMEEYEHRVVHTARETLQMPAVIRLLRTTVNYFKRAPRFSRTNIYARDRGLCQYCGKNVSKSEFQIEHVIPRAQGGRTVWANVVVACSPCNQRKEDKTPQQARMPLLTKPGVPKSLPGMFSQAILWSSNMPDEWLDFIASVHYWHDPLED